MTAETMRERMIAADIPVDEDFIKTITTSNCDDETAESQLQSYITDEPFRNLIIAIEKIYASDPTEFEKLSDKLEEMAV